MRGMKKEPKLFVGDKRSDHRGSVAFVNDFDFKGVKRFYHVCNQSPKIIRGFHGHMKEAKYVYVSRGRALLAFVKLTDSSNPSQMEPVTRVILSADTPAIQYIPPGYANGVRVLTKETDVIFFSTLALAEAKDDDFRFPADYFGKVWSINQI